MNELPANTRVVIVGGGISGLSLLFHLTLEGWTDVVLLERNELTSGTTWHSAAQCPQLAFNQLLLLLRKYTIGLYKELADDPDYPINYHHRTGGLRLLTHQHHVDGCRHMMSVARGVGIEFDLIDSAEAKRRNPLIETDGLLGALWDEMDGDIDPAQLCQALARRSRRAGAKIFRHCAVTGFKQKSNNEWTVKTPEGTINCEHVVVAAGYRANEVGEMLGITYPVISMEHMYFVTEDIPELADRDSRVAMVRCPRDTFYMRQEKQGLLIGVYEYDCKTFGMNGIDKDFVNALCPNDLDRCLPKLEAVHQRLPCLQDAGIKSVINGPIAYAADANPLVGKQPGYRNLWSMNGIRVGIGEGGGYGKMLAQQMVHGETEWDTWQLDPRRISSFCNIPYTEAKSIEDYQREFQWHMPHEHRPAGRPLITSPIYPLLQKAGARFGVVNGWERAEYFAPSHDFIENHTYKFPNWHGIVNSEVKAVHNKVGIAELCGFNRFEITGKDAFDWVSSLTCSVLRTAIDEVSLCYFLNDHGNIDCEATVVRLSDDCLWYCSAAAAELHDMDWLTERLPVNSDITINSLTHTHTTLVIAGPLSKKVMSGVAPRTDWSAAGCQWMRSLVCHIGHAEVRVMAVSFSGEVALELHIPNGQLQYVYEQIIKKGAEFGIAHFGMHAIESMRIEKGYGHWKADLITEFNPIEAGLDRFVDLSKGFPGKAGLMSRLRSGNRRNRVLLAIDSKDTSAQPGEAVLSATDGSAVGSVTSSAWGYRVQKNLAMAYIEPSHSDVGTEVRVLLVEGEVAATVQAPCLYDPAHLILRS